MGLIADFLFGKKRIKSIPNIGNFESRVRINKTSINYAWHFYGVLNCPNRETSIIVEGNSVGPHKGQIEALYELIDSEKEIKRQVQFMIQKSSDIGDFEKLYFIASISTWEENGNSFEITLESIKEDNPTYYAFIWSNKTISEFESHD